MVNNFTVKKLLLVEAYFVSCETSLMKLFAKTVNNTVHYFHEKSTPYPTNIYLFKVNNRNIRKRCEICSKLTVKTPE